MKNAIIFIFLCIVLVGKSVGQSAVESIKKVLSNQEIAWNKGDLEGFMQGYWHSDSLSFIGKNGIKKGWNTTLEGYKKGYPTTSAMGKLHFDLLKIEKLGKKHYYVLGKWQLTREIGDVGGHFSLLWKKIKGKWVIISDHSS